MLASHKLKELNGATTAGCDEASGSTAPGASSVVAQCSIGAPPSRHPTRP